MEPQDGYAPSTDPYQGTVLLLELQGHKNGGQSRIRTHGEVSPTSDFKSDALDQLSHLPKN